MKANDEHKTVEIFSGTVLQAGFLKSMLESEDIRVFLNGEYAGTLVPWWTSPGGVNPVKVIIFAADIEKAAPILEQYEKSLRQDEA